MKNSVQTMLKPTLKSAKEAIDKKVKDGRAGMRRKEIEAKEQREALL